MEEKQERLAELLSVASRLPAAARASFLERAEPRRPDLRAEVLSLIAHDQEHGELVPAELAQSPRSGPWHLLDPLGEAPPARLFRARRHDDPAQRALLAVVEASAAGAPVAAALERQARAQDELDHPGLARLFEARSPDGNWVYAAFRLLEGVPLAELCNVLCLPLTERVRLVEEAARIVAYAHARGVVPVGLLPWSVLATWEDGAPRAALLAIDPWPLLAVLDPQARPRRELLAALETSAPEALRGERRDERSDVFALGALAFELVTGTPPLGLKRLAGKRSLREELRLAAAIRVPLASERIAGLGRNGVQSATACDTTPRALAAALRAGLDSTLERALRADPSERPPSAAAFADELGAWRARRGPTGDLFDSARELARRLGLDRGR